MALVSGHLLVAQAACANDGIKLHAWNLETLFDAGHRTSWVAPHVSHTIDAHTSHATDVHLSTYKSPTHDDFTTAWLLTTSPFMRTAQESVSLKFHISHGAKDFSLPSLKASRCLNFKSRPFTLRYSSSISNAGYAEVNTTHLGQNGQQQDVHIVYSLLEGHTNSRSLDLPDWAITPHMSAYSGALTYATDKEIVVSYYE